MGQNFVSGTVWPSKALQERRECVHDVFTRRHYRFKTTLQPSLLATTSVTDFLSLKTETPVGSRSGSILLNVCKMRTTAYEASSSANSSRTEKSVHRTPEKVVTEQRQTRIRRPTPETNSRSSVKGNVAPPYAVQIGPADRIVLPAFRYEIIRILSVEVTTSMHTVNTVTNRFTLTHQNRREAVLSSPDGKGRCFQCSARVERN